MRLGELLVSEKLVTPEGLEEALESQVVHGGRLGTNLVELGLLQEKDLARLLGKQHNVAFAAGEMTPDPRALELVEPDFADDRDLLPMRLDQTRLTVAVINPHDLEAFDALGFKSGKRVVPVVIPEFRMNQLLRKHFKAFRNLRPIDVNSLRPSRTLAGKEEKAAGPAGDLMSEDEFQSLYAQAMGGADEEEVLEGTLIPEEEQPPAPAALPQAPLPAPPVLTPTPSAEPARVERRAVARATSTPAISPLTFLEAQQLLQASADREDVAKTVLRFALSKWKRSLLLSVQGDLVTGWHGAGQGIREKAVRRIGIALRGQSTFKLVRDTRSHFIGPMKRDAGTAVFYKMLGGGFPKTAVLLPLLLRGKVVHVLYVDDGPDVHTPPDIGELLILSQSVGRSYEAMMRRRKGG
ncbi:MAG: GspE/PulE/PilB domain-containing protein [Myxococcaceae bacterium]